MVNELTHLDLFSGIGGFAIGFQNAGFRTIAFAEVEPNAGLVLSAHWPGIPNLGDVTKLCRRVYDCKLDDETGDAYCPRCDQEFGECECIGTDQFTDEYGFPLVITGGVPCQPASALGSMLGAGDERWMWPDALRIVGELRPAYAVFENPANVLVLPDFHRVLGCITALGYDCWWQPVPAAFFGAGHLRDRLIIFLADSHLPRLERHARHGNGSRCKRERGAHSHRPITTPHLQSRQCSTRDWYAAQSPVQPLVNGLPGRLARAALNCIGNAILPELTEVIAESIRENQLLFK